MKILIIYRHYWPDTPPLGSMLRSLAEHLAARGHRVVVYTAQPSYGAGTAKDLPPREHAGGVRIIRVPLPRETGGRLRRGTNAMLFLAQAFAYAARHRFDVVWTATLPPVVNGLVGLAAAKGAGARFLYHVQDVYPEAAVVGGLMRDGFLARLAARLDSWTCRAAGAVVVLSDDMMRTIAARGGNGAVSFHVINNFILSELPLEQVAPRPAADGAFRLIFAGNIGRFQDLERLLEAMARIGVEAGIELDFLGAGSAQAMLAAQARKRGLSHVRFLDPLPAAQAFARIRDADLGVVSLLPGMYRISFPSKLMTYLAAGLPVLALIEPQSALGRYLDQNRAGLAVDGDAAAIAAAILKAREDYQLSPPARLRLRSLAERDFGRAAAAMRWDRLIESLGPE